MKESESSRNYPLLSIVIPVFNNLEGVRKIYDNLIEFKNIELIIIDDGSNSQNKINSNDFNLCKVINQKNKGVSYARNIGIKYSNGDYITFLDSDDVILSVEEILSCLKNIKDFETIIFFPMVKLYSNGLNELSFSKDLPYKGYVGGKIVNRKFLVNNNFKFSHSISICEDSLFWGKVLICTKNILWVNEAKYLYYQNKSYQLTFKKIFQLCKVMIKLILILVERGNNKKLIAQDFKGILYYFLITIKNKIYAK